MKNLVVIVCCFCLFSVETNAQCFASSGNPVGGSDNIGVLDKQLLRVHTFYRYNYAGKYYAENKTYTGEKRILKDADYNYAGCLLAYGIGNKLTVETEAGYFINKTQHYIVGNYNLTGFGLSNLLFNIKPRLYFNADKRIEYSVSAGINIPFSTDLQRNDAGILLPVDVQPSTGSYGIVLQSFLIKENSFSGWRFFLVNRFEKYFENNNNYIFGNVYFNSFYVTKHFVFEKYKLKDWTAIMQLKNVIKDRNYHYNQMVKASGNVSFFAVPQLNISLNSWNLSVLFEIPVYQYYNEIQLASSYAFSVNVVKDISFNKN
ncbi:MAG: hypothetical protein JXQ69_02660 [Paludibacteraceae bacterium]|nr:hypothetical protein [Paludibacteraceae bacterium]